MMMMMPAISAIVCTHNRNWLLIKAIESLLDQTIDPGRYEIIVVDNVSTDETPETVGKIAQEYARVKYVFEAKVGLSHARNAGIHAARGDIVAFIDDDAIADPGWLAALLQAYDAYPSAWAVGGKTLPLWEEERPDWLLDQLLIALSIQDLGDQPRPLEHSEIMVGTNCSFHRAVFERIGGFSGALGRTGLSLLSGEEVALQVKMRQEELQIYYVPDAVVHHLVPASRLDKSYFWQRAYWQGYSVSVQEHLDHGSSVWFGVAQIGQGLFWLLVRVGGFVGLYPVSCAGDRVRRFCMVCANWGKIQHEIAHLRRTCACWDGEGGR
jgi:glycosyltransferase involved in cell wall biosynthesis